MLNSAQLLSFAGVSLAVALSPGPSWAYVISSTLRGGRQAGFAAVGGNATGILLHTAAVAAGLAALAAQSPALLDLLRQAGAVYLLYLAYRALQSARAGARAPAPPPTVRTTGRIWLGGVTMSVLNPKISLLMLALLPQFVDPARGSTTAQAATLGGLHAAIASLTLITLTLTGDRLRRSPQAERGFQWLSAGALGGFGLHLLLSDS